jgi:hypothetical protein
VLSCGCDATETFEGEDDPSKQMDALVTDSQRLGDSR